MLNKKYYIFLLLVAGVTLVWSCKKDKNEPKPATGEVYMTKRIAIHENGLSDTVFISYDEQHRIKEERAGISSTVYTYNSDGKLSRSSDLLRIKDLTYENGVALYATYSYGPTWEPSDTVFLQFNSDGLISQRTDKSEIRRYTYNSDKRFEMIVNTYLESYHLGTGDTTRLEWDSKGNVVKETFLDGSYDRTLTYTYDDKPNYNKTLHIPYELLILTEQVGMNYYSANNCTSVKLEMDGNSVTKYINILQYNINGYPELINTDTDQIKLFYTY